MRMKLSSVLFLLVSWEGMALAKCREKDQTLKGIVRIGFETQVFIDSTSKKEYWIEKFTDEKAVFPFDEKTASGQDYPATIEAKVSCKPFKIGERLWAQSLVVTKVLKRP